MLNDNDLMDLCKTAGSNNQLPVFEEEQTPPGRKVVNKVKDIGSKIVGGGAAVAMGVNSLTKVAPPTKLNPRY